MKIIYSFLLALMLLACTEVKDQNTDSKKSEITKTLNNWHQAAADADHEKYFSYFESDSSIFMGTDATERWTVAEFKPWSKPYFDRGKAWSFKAEKRFIYFSEAGTTAWFDEALATPNLGPSRGTGVLNKTINGWKIAHYNLTIPIPNELIDEFIPKIDSVLSQ